MQHLGKESATTNPEQTAQEIVYVDHVQVAPIQHNLRTKRPINEGSEGPPGENGTRQTKRAKNIPVTRSKLFPNLKTPAIESGAHESKVGGASMAAVSTTLIEERPATSIRLTPTSASTGPMNQAANVLGTAQRPREARPPRLTKAKREREYRPPVRVPNLPPTPPPPSP